MQEGEQDLTSHIASANVATLFDEMADEYDDIRDFWYAWLFSRLHYFLATFLSKTPSKLACLDVGCGTGFQTILLALHGHDVLGIDIAGKLLEHAERKRPESYLKDDFFKSPFTFVGTYSDAIREIARQSRRGRQLGKTDYFQASATCLPVESESQDLVVCCGSTLNFVTDYQKALREMFRVLRPGGQLFLEVENRYNPDLLWALLDTIFPIRLGYDQSWRLAFGNLLAKRREHVTIDYPFETHAGTVSMPLRLFSRSHFLSELRDVGFRAAVKHGIHSVTNFIPSTSLHSSSPSAMLLKVAGSLAKVEELVGSWPVVRSIGCSTVYLGTK